MPLLTKLLLVMAATVTAIFAAPTTFQETNPSLPVLIKRADYHPSPSSEDDYCGEANPQYLTDQSSPLASDCAAIYKAHPGPGYWIISAAETNSKPEPWVRLASSGSCAFEVRLGQQTVVEYRFGTNDVKFYISSHATETQGKDEKVEVRSGVWCNRHGVKNERVSVDWRVVHV